MTGFRKIYIKGKCLPKTLHANRFGIVKWKDTAKLHGIYIEYFPQAARLEFKLK